MPPSPSKFQGNPSGRGGSTAVDVSDADGKLCYSVPKRHISHYGVDGGGGRLVACRNYTAAVEQQLGGVKPGSDRSGSTQSTNSTNSVSNHSKNSHNNNASFGFNNSNCPMGHRCKFVHIDVPLSSLRSEAIHTHYVWREPSLVTYEMLPPVIAKEQTQFSEQEIADTILTVFGPNNREPSEKIRADRVLMTRGARFAYEAAIGCPRTEDAPPCCHCAHYYFNQVCNRGPNCAFVHVVSISPTISESHIKTSNFHRRISLLGEENLYSNGDGATTSPSASGAHTTASGRTSAQVSRQPSQQRGSILKDDAGEDKHNANKYSNSGRGRSASFPLASADDNQLGRDHRREPSTGSILLNPSVPTTPRVQVGHLPNLPPVALGTTPNDPLPDGEDGGSSAPPPPPSSQYPIQRQQISNSPPPPPPSATLQMRARGASGVSNVGRVANTNNNSFMSVNNPPTIASTPSASRRVSIGPSVSGEAPADHPSGSQIGVSPPKAPLPARSASSSMSTVVAAANSNKRVDDVPPPPPPSQLVRQPSQTMIAAGSNNSQQHQQQQYPNHQYPSSVVAPQQQHKLEQYPSLAQQSGGGADVDLHRAESNQQINYDDGFNANYQDYMANQNVTAYSSATAPQNQYYSSPYGPSYYNNAEYHHGGPGYYQPPPSAGGAMPQLQQQQQMYYGGSNNGSFHQQMSSPNQRLHSPLYKPEMLGDHYQGKPGMPPPPSYEHSFGHLSLGSRPTSPLTNPPAYTSWGTSGQAQGGAANSRPPPPPMPQSQQQQQQYSSYPQSPPYPGGARSNIAAIYQSNNTNASQQQQPAGSNSASAPSLPSPINSHQTLPKSSNPNINGYAPVQGGNNPNSAGKPSDENASPDYRNGPLKVLVGDGSLPTNLLSNAENSSIPSRTGSTVLSTADVTKNVGGEKNSESVVSANQSLPLNASGRYVHNPYSGSGGNSPSARSRTSSMTGPQPQIKQLSQLSPPQVYVNDNQVW